MPTTIAFLGAGRIARALIQGVLKTKNFSSSDIVVTSQSGVSATCLAEELGVTAAANNDEAIEAASIIILSSSSSSMAWDLECACVSL